MKTFFSSRWVNLTTLTLLAVACGLARAQEVSDKESALNAVNAAQTETLRRQEALITAQLYIKEADNLLGKGDYVNALKIYEKSLKELVHAPATATEVTRLNQGAGICYLFLAREEYRKENFSGAMELAQKSYQHNPENRESLALAERASRALNAQKQDTAKAVPEADVKPPRVDPPEISDANFQDKQKRVLEFYRASENYFKSEQFDKAEGALRDILRIDPYSATAYHRLREVQNAKHKKLNAARLQAETQSMMDVDDAWRLPLRRDVTVGPPTKREDDVGTASGRAEILKKLNGIKLQKVEFQDTPIMSAITYLITQGREADLPSHDGVTIIPAFDRSGSGAAAPAPEAAPPAPAPGGDGGAAGGATPPPSPPPEPLPGGSSVTVSLNLQNVTLMQALTFLTRVTTLKLRIDPDAVYIVRGDEIEGRLQTRYFTIAPGLFTSRMERAPTGGPAGGGAPGGGGGAEGGFTAITAGAATVTGPNVRNVFQEFGIEFPRNTSISYNEALGILIVTHTPDVLDQIEAIILRLNQTPPQVQIEAKFMDVRQDDLEELGFRWAFADVSQQQWTIESGLGTALPGIPIGGPYRGLGNPLTGGVRNSTGVTVSALDGLLSGGNGTLSALGANTLLTITGVLTSPQVQIIIDALSQKRMTNLLSAPRVTTTSGESAKILVTREFIYPSAFSEPTSASGSTAAGTSATSSSAVTGPVPTAFSTREVGVILDVNPRVGPDKYTISLTLAPEVVDFEGFIPYTSNAVAGGVTITFTTPQPIFNKRSLTTSVVIWDGQTIVLGGMIRDDTIKINDKVPFLGDLPFVGRFFQSKMEQNTKRNLMIFLSARIVDPAGNPINRRPD